MNLEPETQKRVDHYYRSEKKGKPCCAGCDWWRYKNAVIGDCTKSAPVSGLDRIGMLEIHSVSLLVDSGHVLTYRNHVCGDFVDTYEWNEGRGAF